MKKLLFIIVFYLISCSPLLQAAEVINTSDPIEIARCGQGRLYKMQGQKVLIISGNNYQMGYQHGVLLKDQVKKLTELVLMLTASWRMGGFAASMFDKERDFEQNFSKLCKMGLEAAWKRTKPYIDKRYLQELKGLSDGSGVPLDKLQKANIFPELFHCSGFAIFGKATKNGKLYHGRILDYMTDMGLQDYAVLMLAKPKNKNTFVTVGYAGFIGSVTGMNQKHVAIGEMGGKGQGKWDGVPMTFLLRKALEDADTLAQAVEIFKSSKRTCQYYYVISDGKIPDGRGLACTPDIFEVVKPGQYHQKLDKPVKDAVLLSAASRYDNLVKLVKKNYGNIDAQKALDLMNRPVAMNSCLHRVLFDPAGLKIWVANADSIYKEKYQACYQPYYKYDIAELMKLGTDAP